jgi:hypothetical protein
MKRTLPIHLLQGWSISTICMLVILSFTFLTGCKKDDSPTTAEIMTQKLMAATWKVSSVTVDGTDRTSMFTGMTLKFTSGTYTTTNGHVVWPASGTWTFSNAEATMITRDDGLVGTLTEVTDASLKMSLTWSKTTFGPGRSGSIMGKHEFVMGR